MKNVLFVVDERKMGGVSILLEDMLKMMDISKLNIDILVLHDNGDKLENLPERVNVIYGSKYFEAVDLPINEVIKTKNIKLLLKKMILVFDLKTGLIKNRIKKERKRILNKEYDIEIAFKDGFTALFTAFGNSKKKIHWLHYDYNLANPNEKYDKMFKAILPTFDKIIAVSKGVMDDFNKIYHLENKTKVIPNLIDVDKIKNKAIEAKKRKNKNLEIISVGRLHYMKGYERLIDVISKLKDEKLLKNINFKIYGDGPEKENLENKINELKLNNVVTLMGRVDNPYKYMKEADLFILSSIYEPFGLVIIESLTLGTPVLATSNSATEILIKDNYNGILVDNSIEGLYNGLKDILNNTDKLNELKNNAKNFDYNDQNKIILKEIEKLFK